MHGVRTSSDVMYEPRDPIRCENPLTSWQVKWPRDEEKHGLVTRKGEATCRGYAGSRDSSSRDNSAMSRDAKTRRRNHVIMHSFNNACNNDERSRYKKWWGHTLTHTRKMVAWLRH